MLDPLVRHLDTIYRWSYQNDPENAHTLYQWARFLHLCDRPLWRIINAYVESMAANPSISAPNYTACRELLKANGYTKYAERLVQWYHRVNPQVNARHWKNSNLKKEKVGADGSTDEKTVK